MFLGGSYGGVIFMNGFVCLQRLAVDISIEEVLSALYLYRKLWFIFMRVPFLLRKHQVRVCSVAVASGCCSWTALLADCYSADELLKLCFG